MAIPIFNCNYSKEKILISKNIQSLRKQQSSHQKKLKYSKISNPSPSRKSFNFPIKNINTVCKYMPFHPEKISIIPEKFRTPPKYINPSQNDLKPP